MSTAYTIPSCLAWYRAGIGVFSDAGATSANPGDGVYQWNDQSGNGNHLIQTVAANRPIFNTYSSAITAAGAQSLAPYGNAQATYRPSATPSLLFDGSTSFLNIPAALVLTSAGCTVLLCTRGPYYSPISFGTDGVNTFNYGWIGGSPQKMAIYNNGNQPFPAATFLPTLSPIIHGFRGSTALNETRLYIGLNQISALNQNFANLNLTGGAIGRTLNLGAGPLGNYSFGGEIYEIIIFSKPLSDSDMQSVLTQMHATNHLRPDANASQVAFVGDSLTIGDGTQSISHNYPAVLCQQYGNSFKPLIIATPSHTIAQQQSLVTTQVIPLDVTPFAANVAVVCCGSNDILAGSTASQVITALSALCTSLRTAGWNVIVATITPRNSTTGYTSDNIATLNSVNTTIRTGYSAYADALADWANDPNLSDCTNTTYFSNQINTTDPGDGIKAMIVKESLDAILPTAATPAAAPVSALTYASFYTPGLALAGTFGNFVRSTNE